MNQTCYSVGKLRRKADSGRRLLYFTLAFAFWTLTMATTFSQTLSSRGGLVAISTREFFPQPKFAIVVATTAYADPRIQRLTTSENDARSVVDLLTNVAVCGVAPENVTLLVGTNATTSKFLEAVNGLRAPTNALVYIYFSGRAAEVEQQGYLLMHDTRQAEVSSTALPFRELIAKLEMVSCRVLLAADLRHWTGLIADPSELLAMKAAFLRATPSRFDLLLAVNAGERVTEILHLKHPVLTQLTLAGIGGEADNDGNGFITQNELARYIQKMSAASLRVAGEFQQLEFKTTNDVSIALQSKRTADECLQIAESVASKFLSFVEGHGAPEKIGLVLAPVESSDDRASRQSRQGAAQALAEAWKHDNVGDVKKELEMIDQVFRHAPSNQLALKLKEAVIPPEPPVSIITNSIAMRLAFIPAGTFKMGSPREETGRHLDEEEHWVRFIHGFYIGATEVTQEQWKSIMGAERNPSHFKEDNLPVETVSWSEAVEFCKRLSDKEPGHIYRLPTETEWEYACRGTNAAAPFGFGDRLTTDLANFDGSFSFENGSAGLSRQKTMAVGSFPPNARGLCDLHGNVMEWCSDWHGDYPLGIGFDPVGAASGKFRILRGGAWLDAPQNCRSAFRRFMPAGTRSDLIGFRVVRELQSATSSAHDLTVHSGQ